MTTHFINRTNWKLRFFYRNNKLLNITVIRLLCNARIPPFFDYTCNAWYLNFKKNHQNPFISCSNKWNRFCLKLGCRTSFAGNGFENINWLPIHDGIDQRTLSSISKFYANNVPGCYMDGYMVIYLFPWTVELISYTALLWKVKSASS